MTFRGVILAATALSAALCLGLTFAPGMLWALFGIDGGAAGDFAFRRAGLLFFMLGLVLFALRDLGPGTARRGVAGGMALGMAAMALLGLWEFARGMAGPGLLVPVVTESAFAAAFALVFMRERRG